MQYRTESAVIAAFCQAYGVKLFLVAKILHCFKGVVYISSDTALSSVFCC